MRWLLAIAAVAVLTAGCEDDSDTTTDPTGPGSTTTFVLKFGNTGQFPITELYLKPVADTANWGASILPVDSLHRLEFVRVAGIAKGPTYAFKAQFDSAGSLSFLTHAFMPSGPDTITAFAALGTTGWSVGHNWGLGVLDSNEVDVTP
jgi:hypothetical protein